MTTTPFDGDSYLETPEDQAAYFSEALATGDPRVIVNALNRIARVRGMADVAEASALGRTRIYATLGDKGNPTIDTLMKLLDALGMTLTATPRAA